MSLLMVARVALAAVLALGMLALTAVYALPLHTAQGLAMLQRATAGVHYREQALPGGARIAYLDSDPDAGNPGADDSKPVLVLIHGITSNKDIWLPLIKRYPEFRLLAIDLPGHGDSREPEHFDYRVENMTAQLAAFTEALQLSRFHLVGNSLGGLIGGLYSAAHPHRVQTLVLMNSAGIEAPVKSDFMQQALADAERGFNPLLVQKPEDLDLKLAAVVARPPELPASVRRLAVAQELARVDLNTTVFTAVLSDESNLNKLEPLLPFLQPPTLLLWGDSDRVFHVSTVARALQLAPALQAEVLAGCGHLPMIEATGKTASILRNFFQAEALPRAEARSQAGALHRADSSAPRAVAGRG